MQTITQIINVFLNYRKWIQEVPQTVTYSVNMHSFVPQILYSLKMKNTFKDGEIFYTMRQCRALNIIVHGQNMKEWWYKNLSTENMDCIFLSSVSLSFNLFVSTFYLLSKRRHIYTGSHNLLTCTPNTSLKIG